MSFRFPTEAAALAVVLLSGCSKSAPPAASTEQSQQAGVLETVLIPGHDAGMLHPDPPAAAYYNNADAVNTGKRLFGQYNCSGCHSNGGGGMAPALMDDVWIYGGRLEQIHDTLVEGRPNGMPAWGGKVPDEQLWQIAAYVRSMSLPQTLAAETGNTPSQTPAPIPPEADQDAGWSPSPTTTNDYTHTTVGPAR